MENKDCDYIWNVIFNDLKNKTIEIQTKKLNNEAGVWFSVNVSNDYLLIGKSIKNKPSSKLKYQRKINKNEFFNIYPFYNKWVNNEMHRYLLRKISQNTSYILAIINYYEENIGKGHCT